MEHYLGKEIPKLGFGLMRLPKNGEEIDVEQTKEMVDLFLEAGFNYFDTSWGYIGSEAAAREALVKRHPRESYLLATKCPAWAAKTKEKAQSMLDKSLERTGAGYFDFYLLHNLGESRSHYFDDYGIWEFLAKKKEEGVIRHLGFSFHDKAEELDKILTAHPEMEFVQLQINYLDWESEWIQARKCYEIAVKHGKPVIVMEPVKGGTLAKVPEEAEKLFRESAPHMSVPSWAIRFAASLDNVMMVLSGMSSLEQLEDNLSYMEHFQPLTEEEKKLTGKVADIINAQIAVPCTGCSYCTEGCPQKIAIPQYFSLYNEDMRENLEEKGWTINFTQYEILTGKFGKAKDCVECGQCESVCPQHLPIMEKLKDVSAHFDH